MNRIKCVYFSPTGTTRQVAERIGETLARKLAMLTNGEMARDVLDFTLSQARTPAEVAGKFCFSAEEVVILALPVYAGRVPNLLLPFLKNLHGNGALGIPVVLYGNRNFDDALIELRELMAAAGFRVMAAGAFVGRHSFSDKIAGKRPDANDLEAAECFAGEIAQKWARMKTEQAQCSGKEKGNGTRCANGTKEMPAVLPNLKIPGRNASERGYYQPRNEQGEPIDIRKVKPQTGEGCTGCGQCAAVCPMGAISFAVPGEIIGICIKCCACVRICPVGAKHFTDAGFLHHVRELEETLGARRRKEPVTFL